MIKYFKIERILRKAWKEIPKDIRNNLRNIDFKDEYISYINTYLNRIEDALKVNPKSLKVLEEKLTWLFACKRYKECINTGNYMLDHCVVQGKVFSDFYSVISINKTIGECYYKLNDNINARKHLEIALSTEKFKEYASLEIIQEEAKNLLNKINNN